MGGGKETPRQKMIGMMYLVLTAMLALNVSVEVLKSFIIVNEAVEETNESFKKKVESVYTSFLNAYEINPLKVGENWEKAQNAKKLSRDIYDYVESVKYELIAETEGVSLEVAKKLKASDLKKQDNYDIPSNFFIGQSEDGSAGKASELRLKLEEFKKSMLGLLDEGDRRKVEIGLNTEGPYYDANGNQKNWEMQFFYKTIIVADLTILSKLQAEILNTEFDIISQLYSSVSDDDFKFDNIAARVVPSSNYILEGNTYEAEIFVAAFDSKSQITGTIGGQHYKGDSGRLKFTRIATNVGPQTIDGTINVQGALGIKEYPFKLSYVVAPPMATVSAEAMNVLYIGVDNPISAMAAGVPEGETKVTISSGSISKISSGKYVARVNTPGRTSITVYAASPGGDKKMGSYEYRVKRVPDPVARVNGQDVGVSRIERTALANAGGLLVEMKDFDFQLNVSINSFTMQISRSGELTTAMTSNGNRFSEDMIDNIKRCRRGDKVFIENITAKMPDGNRALNPIVLSIQ